MSTGKEKAVLLAAGARGLFFVCLIAAGFGVNARPSCYNFQLNSDRLHIWIFLKRIKVETPLIFYEGSLAMLCDTTLDLV